MVAPIRAYAVLANTALEESQKLAAQLDTLIPADPTATTQFPRPDFTKTEQITKPESDIDSNDLLDAIQSKLDVARAADDVAAVERLIEEGKAVLVREFMTREKALAEAQEAYDKALDEFSAAGPVTIEASKELEKRRKLFKDYELFIPEQEAYYDSLIENAEVAEEVRDEYSLEELRQKTREELLSIFDAAVETYKARIQEIEAEKAKVIASATDDKKREADKKSAEIKASMP